MQPQTAVDWENVAKARAADADALVKAIPTSVSSVYMAGYAVECSLKAFLSSAKRPYPSRGSAGHDLVGLWKASNFRKRDVPGEAGCATFFFESWNTSIRYELTISGSGISNQDLVDGAKRIAGWLLTQSNRQTIRRRRPR
ncbi:MAG TPA: hypothetical protein VK578_19495 [Edaphobacter sp.]|nr:hypothetical protein [Edaphobacter sp.]